MIQPRSRKCYWCGSVVMPNRRSRILAFNDVNFYFHQKCREKFMEYNPNTWMKRLEDAARGKR